MATGLDSIPVPRGSTLFTGSSGMGRSLNPSWIVKGFNTTGDANQRITTLPIADTGQALVLFPTSVVDQVQAHLVANEWMEGWNTAEAGRYLA